MKKVSDVFAFIRSSLSLTIEKSAKLLNTSKSSYYNYENGRQKVPAEVIDAFADVIHISSEELLSDNCYLLLINDSIDQIPEGTEFYIKVLKDLPDSSSESIMKLKVSVENKNRKCGSRLIQLSVL